MATAAHTATATLLYGNAGPHSTLGPIQATIVTPFYTSVDRTKPLPAGCRVVLRDETIATPEIVVCSQPRLAKVTERTLRIPLKTFGSSIAGKVLAPALIAALPPLDVDIDQTDNLDSIGMLIPSTAP